MPFYALSTISLIRKLYNSVIHTWYADDASACGKISDLRVWWDRISVNGPPYGYLLNASKTWLAVKDCYLNSAKRTLFADTCINVTSDGRPHLGAAVRSATYTAQYVSNKVTTWVQEQLLSFFCHYPASCSLCSLYSWTHQ